MALCPLPSETEQLAGTLRGRRPCPECSRRHTVSPRVRVWSATAVYRADPRDRESVNAVERDAARSVGITPVRRCTHPMPRHHRPGRSNPRGDRRGCLQLRGFCAVGAPTALLWATRINHDVSDTEETRANVDDVRPPPPTGGRNAGARGEASSRSRPPARQRSSRAADRQTAAAGARTAAGHVQQLINRRRARALRTASPYPSLLK